MIDLEEMKKRITALDAKSALMITYANLQMVKTGIGHFTSDECSITEVFCEYPCTGEELTL